MHGWLRNLIGQSIKAKRISRSRQPGGAIVHPDGGNQRQARAQACAAVVGPRLADEVREGRELPFRMAFDRLLAHCSQQDESPHHTHPNPPTFTLTGREATQAFAACCVWIAGGEALHQSIDRTASQHRSSSTHIRPDRSIDQETQ